MSKRRSKIFKNAADETSSRYFIYHDGTPVEIKKTDTGVSAFEPKFGAIPGKEETGWHWVVNNHFLNLAYQTSKNWQEVQKPEFTRAFNNFKTKESWKYETGTPPTPAA